MSKKVYDINFDKLVNWLVPAFIRNQIITNWLIVLVGPVVTGYQNFIRFRNQKLYDLSITPQVCFLQKLLNDRYDFTLRRIIIVDGEDKPPTYVYLNTELKPLYIKRNSENSPVIIYTDGESGAITDDFVIKVPLSISFDDKEMKSLIKFFKLAGTKFKIQRV